MPDSLRTKARFKRRILHAPNAIQTMYNEEAYLIIYCLNCIRCMQNSTFETGLTFIQVAFSRKYFKTLNRGPTKGCRDYNTTHAVYAAGKTHIHVFINMSITQTSFCDKVELIMDLIKAQYKQNISNMV